MLKTFQGPQEVYLYATSMYPQGVSPTVCFGDGRLSFGFDSLLVLVNRLESLQQPRVESQT